MAREPVVINIYDMVSVILHTQIIIPAQALNETWKSS